MADFLSWLLANYQTVVTPLAYCVLAMVVCLRLVAPITKTNVDDRALGFLDKLYHAMARLLVGKALPKLPKGE